MPKELTDSKAAVETCGARLMAMDPEVLGILGTRFRRTWIDAQHRLTSLLEGGEFPTVACQVMGGGFPGHPALSRRASPEPAGRRRACPGEPKR